MELLLDYIQKCCHEDGILHKKCTFAEMINMPDKSGRTALTLAAQGGHVSRFTHPCAYAFRDPPSIRAAPS